MIGGKETVILQVKTGTIKNDIGERIPVWSDALELVGWLDYASGESRYNSYNAKIQETTHMFVCDFQPIPDVLTIEGKVVKVNAEKSRIRAKNGLYDVVMIDDPMNLHKQLEIYLKYTGGQ